MTSVKVAKGFVLTCIVSSHLDATLGPDLMSRGDLNAKTLKVKSDLTLALVQKYRLAAEMVSGTRMGRGDSSRNSKPKISDEVHSEQTRRSSP